MNSRTIVLVRCVLFSLVLIMVVGCAGVERRYMTLEIPAERLRTIETFNPSEVAREESEETPPQEAPAEMALTIEECRAAALTNNLDIQAVLVDPVISGETVSEERARFEALFFGRGEFAKTDTPTSSTLSASTAESHYLDIGVEMPLRTGGTLVFDSPYQRVKTNNAFATLNPSFTSDLSASISQPLLRGAGTRTNTHAIRLALYRNQASEARTKLAITRVLAEVDRVYWRVYAARRELEVRVEEHKLALVQLERAKRRVEAGASSEVEIIRAETGVAEKLEAIIIAENRLRRTERNLKRALNRPDMRVMSPTVILPETEPEPVHYAFDEARLLAASVDNRMEMLEIELQIAAEASTIDFNRNQALPLLALDYTYNVNGLGSSRSDSYDLLFDKRFEDHAVGLQLEIPLGNAAARSRLRRSVARRIQSLATREARKIRIEQEVLDAVDQVEASWQRLLANRQRTALAQRNLDAEVRQFELGLRTSTDVLDAQTRLGNAHSAEIDSLAGYEIALVDLAFATGTVLGAAKVQWEPASITASGR